MTTGRASQLFRASEAMAHLLSQILGDRDDNGNIVDTPQVEPFPLRSVEAPLVMLHPGGQGQFIAPPDDVLGTFGKHRLQWTAYLIFGSAQADVDWDLWCRWVERLQSAHRYANQIADVDLGDGLPVVVLEDIEAGGSSEPFQFPYSDVALWTSTVEISATTELERAP